MENLFQNAMWISFKSNARGKKNKVNPWENVIDAKIRKTDIEKGSGLPVFKAARSTLPRSAALICI